MESCYRERIFYYWMHCLYGHVQLLCENALANRHNDIYLIIFRSLSQAIVGDTEQSLSSLNSLQHRADLSFLLSVSFYFAHKFSRDPNSTQISELRGKIENSNHNLPLFVAEFSSEIAFLFGDYELAEAIINNSGKTVQTNSILGWVKMKKGELKKSEEIFDEILSTPSNSFHLLTLYGQGKLYFLLNQFSDAFQLYARILSKFEFPEINFEKTVTYMVKGNWNFLNEQMTKIENSLPTTIEIKIFSFYDSFFHYEDVKKAVKSIEKVIEICKKIENKNWFLMASLSHSFGTIGCRNEEILFHSMKLAQMAANARNDSSYCLSVLGYHQLMNCHFLIAQNSLFESFKYDKTNLFCEENIMRMNLSNGNINLLKDELDLYSSIQDKTLFILFFITKVSRVLNKLNHKVLFELIEKINNHLLLASNDSSFIYSSEIKNSLFANIELPFMKFIELSINLHLEIVFDALDEILLCFEFPKILFNTEIISTINNILKKLSNLLPGNTTLHFYKGCFLFIQKRYFESLNSFQSILVSINPFRIQYTLLMIAAIYVKQNDLDLASQYLNESYFYDKTISNEFLYKLIDVRIHSTSEKIEKTNEFILNSFDQIPFLILLSFVDVFIQNNSFSKALKILKMMLIKCNSKIEKSLIVIRQAKIRASRDNNLDRAIFLLNQLKKHPRVHESVVLAESEIYLNIFHNEQKYIQILKENYEESPTQKNLEILGDGYSLLKMFNEASQIYIKAIFGQKSVQKFMDNDVEISFDPEIAQKCVKSLIKSHQYNDAVLTFSKLVSRMKSNKQIIISLLFELIQINKLDEVKKCLSNISVLFLNIAESNTLINADFLGIKAFFQKNNNELNDANETYEKAVSIYEGFLNSRKENVYITAMKERASQVSIEAGHLNDFTNRKEKAFEFYKKAYNLMPTNQNALLLLVDHYKQREDIMKCINLCEEFLRKSPYSESVVLLYTSLQNQDLKKSINVMKNFLTFKPRYHKVIVRLVEICSRAGGNSILIAKKFLSSDNEPGMVFARGVFDFFKGEIERAFNHFDCIKNDRKWGTSAKLCMIEIYLNPKRKYIWEENEPLANEEDIQKARTLIDQIYIQNSCEGHVEPEKELLLAELEKSSNTDSSVNEAASRYQKILNQSQTEAYPSTTSIVAALVGLASCYMRLYRQKEAVQLVDKLIKPTQSQSLLAFTKDEPVILKKPTHETVSYYEEAYLIRAHAMMISTTTGSQQSALHFAYLALDLNQSCRKGWSICAEAYSRNGMYDDAAKSYKNSWLLSKGQLDSRKMMLDEEESEKVTDIGYLYAESSLKAKKPEDALEMCRELLNINPCFDDLREKIIIPSFRMLKQ